MDMIKMFNFHMTKSTAFILHLPLSQHLPSKVFRAFKQIYEIEHLAILTIQICSAT